MNLKELDSFKMSDAIGFHDELNPKLWDGQELRPEVKEQLLYIAKDFLIEMGVDDLDVVDITVSGSNAAYSYTPHSDLDLHILVDLSKLDHNEIYKELFNAKKTIYNDTHDITIHGVPVELYVQDAREPVVSLGEYSILHNEWLRIPTKRRANLDQTATKAKYEKLLRVIQKTLQSKNIVHLDKTLKKIKQYRQAGLDHGGEFGPENLAYKVLRSQGLISKLYNLRDKLHSEHLTIDEDVQKSFSGSQIWNYVKKIHPADQQGGGFLKSLIVQHPKWELKQVPLNQIRIPDPYAEDDFEDAYNRVLDIDMYHVNDITSHDINKMPIVVDSDGFIIDGNHRALSAKLRGMKTIPAYVPVSENISEASGYIPSEKEKNDPRFKTALTVDIKPDSIQKNAKAFNSKVTRAGIPPTLQPSGKF